MLAKVHIMESLAIPGVLNPILEDMYTDKEFDLIEYIGKNSRSLQELKMNGFSDIEIENAYQRKVINKVSCDGKTQFCLTPIEERFERFIMEDPQRWRRYPIQLREAICEWDFNESLQYKLNQLNSGKIPIHIALPLTQILEYVESKQPDFYVHDCNCRTTVGNCDKPVTTCISFRQDDRSLGRKITKDEVKQLLVKTDKEGLVHFVEGEYGICNCCGCCCYPMRVYKKIGHQNGWPQIKYQAVIDQNKCIRCMACKRRCQVDAIITTTEKVCVDDKKCIGCGLCESTCPMSAVTIKEL